MSGAPGSPDLTTHVRYCTAWTEARGSATVDGRRQRNGRAHGPAFAATGTRAMSLQPSSLDRCKAVCPRGACLDLGDGEVSVFGHEHAGVYAHDVLPRPIGPASWRVVGDDQVNPLVETELRRTHEEARTSSLRSSVDISRRLVAISDADAGCGRQVGASPSTARTWCDRLGASPRPAEHPRRASCGVGRCTWPATGLCERSTMPMSPNRTAGVVSPAPCSGQGRSSNTRNATPSPRCGPSSGRHDHGTRQVCGQWFRRRVRRSCRQYHNRFRSPFGAVPRRPVLGGR